MGAEDVSHRGESEEKKEEVWRKDIRNTRQKGTNSGHRSQPAEIRHEFYLHVSHYSCGAWAQGPACPTQAPNPSIIDS